MVSLRRSLLATFCWAVVAGPACDAAPESSSNAVDGGAVGVRDASADITVADEVGWDATVEDVVAEPRASDVEAGDVKVEPPPTVDAQPPDDPTCLWPVPVAGACGLFRSLPVPLMPRVDCLRPKRTLIAGMPSPRDLKVDAQGVYWVSDEVLYRLRDGETKADELAVVTGRHSFALDDDYVYFGRDTRPERCAIMRVKRDGADLAAVVDDLLCDIGSGKPEFVLDGDRLYYRDPMEVQATLTTVASVLKVGGDKITTEFFSRVPVRPRLHALDLIHYRNVVSTVSSSKRNDELVPAVGPSRRLDLRHEVVAARRRQGARCQELLRQHFGRAHDAGRRGARTMRGDLGLGGPTTTPRGEQKIRGRRAIHLLGGPERHGSVEGTAHGGHGSARVLGGADAAVTNYGDIALTPTKVFIANLTDGAIDVIDR